MYIGWHPVCKNASALLVHVHWLGSCISFASTSSNKRHKKITKNPDYNIANFDVKKLPVLEVCFYTPRSGGVTSVLDANHSHELPQLVTPPMNHQNRVRCQKSYMSASSDTPSNHGA